MRKYRFWNKIVNIFLILFLSVLVFANDSTKHYDTIKKILNDTTLSDSPKKEQIKKYVLELTPDEIMRLGRAITIAHKAELDLGDSNAFSAELDVILGPYFVENKEKLRYEIFIEELHDKENPLTWRIISLNQVMSMCRDYPERFNVLLNSMLPILSDTKEEIEIRETIIYRLSDFQRDKLLCALQKHPKILNKFVVMTLGEIMREDIPEEIKSDVEKILSEDMKLTKEVMRLLDNPREDSKILLSGVNHIALRVRDGMVVKDVVVDTLKKVFTSENYDMPVRVKAGCAIVDLGVGTSILSGLKKLHEMIIDPELRLQIENLIDKVEKEKLNQTSQ